MAYSRDKESPVFLRHAIGHKPSAICSGLDAIRHILFSSDELGATKNVAAANPRLQQKCA